ncbi:SipW-dependent-type signal peptide-containing protein [Microbacterium sp. P01]|uniref:SipW-dependent-type signal peptide-containing protein n=1 Tax=unclassified Microbacterium TaxID=2609290 RepID=UPI00366DD2BA
MSGPHTLATRRERRRTAPGGRRRWSTRVRAVLAGALVLGVGTSVTLAAWSDDEFGAGTFAASTFVVESQTGISTWAAHESGSPATLAFAASAMSPAVSQYAYIDIRTTAATNISGTAALTAVSAATGTLLPQLEYRVAVTAATAPCNASAFTSATIPAYTATLATTTSPPSVSGALAAAGGSTVRFCFDVRVKAGTASTFQGGTAGATWQFTSTSSS